MRPDWPRFRGGTLAMVLAASGFVASARQPAAPKPQTPPQPTFSVAVNLVTTDVIPRDAAGRFIAGLNKQDFTVLEDGVAQDVVSFVMVHGGRTFNLVTPPAPEQEGVVLPSARPPDVAGRVFLILVDDLHLLAHDTPHVRALLRKMVKTLVHDGDLCGLLTTGTSAVTLELTYDRGRLDEVISKVQGNGLTFADLTQTSEGPGGPADVRRRASVAFGTFYDAIGDLSRINNRRKAVLLVSNGYDFDPFPDARRGTDKVFGGRYGTPAAGTIDESNPFFRSARVTADSDLAAQLVELSRAASRANAAVYALDPRGLVGTTDAGQQIDLSEWTTNLARMRSSLQALSEESGGFAVVNDNDFEPALKRIDGETSDYYVLGYYSSNTDPAKRVRQLEVKVSRPDVTVSARRAYSLKPATPPVARQ